jgi:hypothetical protein
MSHYTSEQLTAQERHRNGVGDRGRKQRLKTEEKKGKIEVNTEINKEIKKRMKKLNK